MPWGFSLSSGARLEELATVLLPFMSQDVAKGLLNALDSRADSHAAPMHRERIDMVRSDVVGRTLKRASVIPVHSDGQGAKGHR